MQIQIQNPDLNYKKLSENHPQNQFPNQMFPQQQPQINQNFQLAPMQNNSELEAKYVNGIDDVKKILEKLVFPHIKANDQVEFVDYKSRLQEYIQAESRKALEYIEEHVEGPAHNRTFTIKVVHEGIVLGVGVGKTKKDASQQAAKQALEKMASK
mgnify:CR=1 FL=1